MQPSHETSDMRWAEQRVGPERAKGAYAWATMQKFGVRLAFGTDYDVEPISPFRGLYACVTRELPNGGPKGGWQPQERISIADCIRAYTSGSAYGEFMEGKKGELKAGEFADFIVLSNDLTKVEPRGYTNTTVLRTVVGGQTVVLQGMVTQSVCTEEYLPVDYPPCAEGTRCGPRDARRPSMSRARKSKLMARLIRARPAVR